ncbi:MAG: NYN domain-containing protein [Oligoflexales bacterium]
MFIDGGYVLAQFKYNKITPDFKKIADYLLAPLRRNTSLDLLRCYFYYCAPWVSQPPTEDELKRMDVHNQFVADIESIQRWAVRLGKLEKRWDGSKEYYEQKRVDVLLSCDMVRHSAARDIQHAILVAGDSDFIPAILAAKDSGVTLTLWCGQANTVHKDLIRHADEVHTLDWKTFPQIRSGGESPKGEREGNGRSRRRRSSKKKPRQDAPPAPVSDS